MVASTLSWIPYLKFSLLKIWLHNRLQIVQLWLQIRYIILHFDNVKSSLIFIQILNIFIILWHFLFVTVFLLFFYHFYYTWGELVSIEKNYIKWIIINIIINEFRYFFNLKKKKLTFLWRRKQIFQYFKRFNIV